MSAPGGVITHPGKVWADAREALDNADLDAGAQPLFELEPDSVGTAEIYAPGVLAKIATGGGPGLRGLFTLANAYAVQAAFNLAFGTCPVAGAKIGDLVTVAPVNPALNLVIGGNCLKAGLVTLSAFNFTGGNISIPAGSGFAVLVYNL